MNKNAIATQENQAPAVLGGQHIIALRPSDMTGCQAQLIAWARAEWGKAAADLREAEELVEYARKNKIRVAPFQARVRRSASFVSFYEKAVLAFEAGYVLIPPIQADYFAVRVDRKKPVPLGGTYNSARRQDAQTLPAGEGRFVSDLPMVCVTAELEEKDGAGKLVTKDWWEAVEYQEVGFPFAFVKPEILGAVGDALEKKIFDSIGAVPRRRARDPLIVGRINHPNKYHDPLMFFVAWWFVPAQFKFPEQ